MKKPCFEIDCLNCNKKFLQKVSTQKYCKVKCSQEFQFKKIKQHNFYINKTSPSTVGAASELIASVDLLKRGYEVYRAVSPSSSSDLIIKKDNKISSVEVRTGRYTDSGKLWFPNTNMRSDYFAVVIYLNNSVVYIPELL